MDFFYIIGGGAIKSGGHQPANQLSQLPVFLEHFWQFAFRNLERLDDPSKGIAIENWHISEISVTLRDVERRRMLSKNSLRFAHEFLSMEHEARRYLNQLAAIRSYATRDTDLDEIFDEDIYKSKDGEY